MTDSHYRVVVGMDLETAGDNALRTALELAHRAVDFEVHLVHVLPPRVDNDVGALSRELDAAAAKVEGRARALIGPSGLHMLRVHVRYGRVVETIEQICVDYDADLIIVGTHDRRGPARIVLGSIARALTESAPVPVVVARPKDYAGFTRSPGLDPARPGEDLHHDQLVSERIGVGPRVAHISGLL